MTGKPEIGAVVGRLCILSEGVSKRYGSQLIRTWVCKCSCGVTVTVAKRALISGNTQSCGCLMRERARHTHTKHGHSAGKPSRSYRCWCSMLERCMNPNQAAYPYYGGRGITVCAEWRVFENFLADMGEVPPGLTLERINVNGDYGPQNCRWATRSEQAANKRSGSTQMISYKGETKSPAMWAKDLAIPLTTIHSRRQSGRAVAEILSTEKLKGGKRAR